jgi:hypothetical protein
MCGCAVSLCITFHVLLLRCRVFPLIVRLYMSTSGRWVDYHLSDSSGVVLSRLKIDDPMINNDHVPTVFDIKIAQFDVYIVSHSPIHTVALRST